MTASFAEGLFGWVNHLVEWLFSLGREGKLDWIGEHWLTLVLVIAVFCVGMDITVWMVRYKPYKRWLRLLRSLSKDRVIAKEPSPRPERNSSPSPAIDKTRGISPAINLANTRPARAQTGVSVTQPIDPPTLPQGRAPRSVLDVPTMPGKRPPPVSSAEKPAPIHPRPQQDEPSTRE